MRLLGVSFTTSLSSSRHLWSIRVYAQNIADWERVSVEMHIYSLLLLLNRIGFLFFIWQVWLWMAKCAAPLSLPVCLCAEEQHKDTLWRTFNLKVKVDCKLLLLTLLLGLTERELPINHDRLFFFSYRRCRAVFIEFKRLWSHCKCASPARSKRCLNVNWSSIFYY